MTNISNSIRDIVFPLNDLNSKLGLLKHEICEFHAFDIKSSQDARIVFLNQLQERIVAVLAIFNMYTHLQQTNSAEELSNIISICEIIARGVEEKTERDKTIIFNYLRLSLIDYTYFHIENLFYNLARVLNLDKSTSGYWNVISKVLDGISFKGQGKEYFSVLSHLRNSLHNNGMHRKASWGHELFEFKSDQIVTCASWRCLIDLIVNVLIPIEHVLKNEAFAKGETIKDDFSAHLINNSTLNY